jgi:r-opsin
LTICDFLACCLHPLAVYSAFRGRWSFGQTGRSYYRPIEFTKILLI